MPALKKRLERIEKVQAPKQAEPIVIEWVLVAPDGAEVGVVRRVAKGWTPEQRPTR